MSDGSNIEWTDATWNAIRGCTRVSAGCVNCYAERQAIRQAGPGGAYEGLVRIHEKADGRREPRWTGQVRVVDSKITEPLRWRKPRRVFVNSMADLFHEGVSDEDIDAHFAVMLACEILDPPRRHTFQILTKRAERMRRYFETEPRFLVQRWARAGDLHIHMDNPDILFSEYVAGLVSRRWDDDWRAVSEHRSWGFVDNVFPLRGVHLGVSIEDQATADERIPLLLECPAAVRWVSYEPALAPIDFAAWLDRWRCKRCRVERPRDGFSTRLGKIECGFCMQMGGLVDQLERVTRPDWIVVGGESGPGARPFDLAWARSTIEQGRDAGVPVFVKQVGAHAHDEGLAWLPLRDRKGGEPREWPSDLRVREFPRASREERR